MKKCSVRTAIILPVVALMAVLPFVTYAFFGRLLEGFVKNQSYKDMAQAAKAIVEAADQSIVYSFDGESDQTATAKAQIKTFTALIKEMSKTRKFNVRVVIANAKWKITYPAETLRADSEMLSYFQAHESQIIPAKAFGTKNIIQVTTESGESLAIACHLGQYEKIRTRYLIMYHPIENLDTFKHSASRIVFIITALFSTLSIAILYMVSGSIVRPLTALRKNTEKIGTGQFTITGVSSRITEIGEIAAAIDSMALKLAKSDDEQKVFFQNASHELRTPLMSIRGYAEGIACGLFKEDRQAGQVILQECARLSALVEDILSLSRMDNQRQETDIQPIDICAFLNGCLKRFEAVASQKGLSISLSAKEGRPFVLADEGLLDKIFDNLFSNAIRYAQTTISVNVSAQADCIRVLIENDGKPISEAELEKVFVRFYKGAGGNFGIGLSVAKTCAEYMGGTLRALHRENGTAFEAILVKAKRL